MEPNLNGVRPKTAPCSTTILAGPPNRKLTAGWLEKIWTFGSGWNPIDPAGCLAPGCAAGAGLAAAPPGAASGAAEAEPARASTRIRVEATSRFISSLLSRTSGFDGPNGDGLPARPAGAALAPRPCGRSRIFESVRNGGYYATVLGLDERRRRSRRGRGPREERKDTKLPCRRRSRRGRGPREERRHTNLPARPSRRHRRRRRAAHRLSRQAAGGEGLASRRARRRR